MGRVLITDYVTNPDIEHLILGQDLTFTTYEDVEVLLVWHQQIDAEYLDLFPNLKGVVRYGVGFDSVDLRAISQRHLLFCNTPDYGTDEVSDTALAMLLNISRGVSAYDQMARGLGKTWQENTRKELMRSSEQMVGVVGAGRIGTAFLRKVKAVGFKTGFYDPFVSSGYEKAIAVERFQSLSDLLRRSDYVSIHLPLNEQTRGLVNSDFLSSMRPRASLINTARGEIIDNLDDIYASLHDGHLFSVALDVLPEEPPSDCQLVLEWRRRGPLSDRIIINPHTAYYSQQAFHEMRSNAALNAKRILDGQKPLNIIVDSND